MNPEIKQKWLDALTNGTYKQGRKALRIKDEYCCLGVLCDLYVKETKSEWKIENPISEEYSICNERMGLPAEVILWAELNSSAPYFGTENLIYLNDTMRKSFLEIAEVISTNNESILPTDDDESRNQAKMG